MYLLVTKKLKKRIKSFVIEGINKNTKHSVMIERIIIFDEV
jgi:hypothetical protein